MAIDNILSRVTGGNISNIDGLIRANGTANLFLVNPAGMIFGENARLDVGGSFVGSSATGLLFEDGTVFSSGNLSTPLLTINAPIGLDLRGATGDIISVGNLSSDRDFSLAANNLYLQGELQANGDLSLQALDKITIRDNVSKPGILKAGKNLLIQGDRIDLAILNSRASGLFADDDLVLISNNPINGDAHYYSGGDFRLQQLDGNLGKLISTDDPIVRSQGDVSLAGYQGASLHILAGGNVIIDGDIRITGIDTSLNSLQERVTISDGREIEIDGSREPTLDIRAGTIVTPEFPTATTTATGSDIRINGTVINPGGKVFLSNQYQSNPNLAAGDISVTAINSSNSLGNGGDVIVDARNNINVVNGINTASVVDTQLTTVANLATFPVTSINSGNGGSITLLSLGDILAGDFNSASRINLDLNTEVDTITEANNIFAIPQADLNTGEGGAINLRAGSNINVGNLDSSAAIAVASNINSLDNFGIVATLLKLNTANGGNIKLEAGKNLTTANINSSVSLSDRSSSSAQTTPNITLSVAEITLNIPQANLGSSGEINLKAGKIINTGALNSAVLVVNNSNNQAQIVANNPLVATAQKPSRAISRLNLTAEITIGKGGNITIDSPQATLTDVNSSIGVTSENIVFAQANADNSTAVNSFANSNINLNVVGDRPGTINFKVEDGLRVGKLNAGITTNAVNNLDSKANSQGEGAIALPNNTSSNTIRFNAQADFANINLQRYYPDLPQGINKVPDLLNIDSTSFNPCPVNNAVNTKLQPIETSQGKIYPARGIEIKNGKVRLTPQPNNNSPARNSQPDSCN
ncbi:hypothetical protein NIES4102_19250 [Chondrocystis sp. NIES-4102]|nr:hypothetical protein NIES4102_19250 [Chondrocystis sp. NIES-4102]